jgi:signal transduction histidine kinase
MLSASATRLFRIDGERTEPPLANGEGRPASEFAEQLQRQLGAERVGIVRVWPQAWPPALGLGMRRGMGMGPGHGMGPGFAGRVSGVGYFAQVRLADGDWLTARALLPVDPPPRQGTLWASLLLVGLLMLALSLAALRRATRPLRMLAQAAEALGADLHRPPLPETGPRELRQAAGAFNAMQQRIVRTVEERTRILSAVSHDLKTPITRLKLRAELIDDPPLREKFARDLDEMEGMVGATLEFMRGLDTSEAPQPVNVQTLLESLQADAAEMGRRVALTGSARAPYPARPQALKRCLANLIDNAVGYGGEAQIEIADGDDALVITVRDRGPGIPPEELERVFEPFYRVEASRSRHTGGTGLGLSIARNIAGAHGGELTLANRPEGGLEARLALPRRPAS